MSDDEETKKAQKEKKVIRNVEEARLEEERERKERIKDSKKLTRGEPSKDIQVAIDATYARIHHYRKQHIPLEKPYLNEDGIPWHVYSDLIGELRVGEIRKRLFYSALFEQKEKEYRYDAIVLLQPNAIQSLRLKYLLAISKIKVRRIRDPLDSAQRMRLCNLFKDKLPD